jgi:hypothetical protein
LKTPRRLGNTQRFESCHTLYPIGFNCFANSKVVTRVVSSFRLGSSHPFVSSFRYLKNYLKFGCQKICFVECPKKALSKEVFVERQQVGPRQRLTVVSFRRPLTALCREPPSPSVWYSAKMSLPSVLHSVNELVIESRTLPSAALDKGFFAECPTKSTWQSS